jgi:hypothetical protein
MGSGHYDISTAAFRAKTRDAVATTASVTTSVEAGKREALLDRFNLAKKSFRECRNSKDSPNATPITIFIDGTGSMGKAAHDVMNKMHQMFENLIKEKAVAYPQLSLGVVGDATCDKVPLQVSEFEIDNNIIDDNVDELYLEGMGGGTKQESYELALYFLANMVQADCFDNGGKGFAFIIGDEMPYETIKKDYLKRVCGVDVQEDIPLEAIMDDVNSKWDLYLLRPKINRYAEDREIISTWEKFIDPEKIILMQGLDDVVAAITNIICLRKGKTSNLKGSDTLSTSLSRITADESNDLVVTGLDSI